MRTLIRGLFEDLRHASRGIRRDPRFALLATLVLALGIGGNTTVFSVVNALLLHPFPYRDPDRLIEITSRTPPDATWSPAVRVADFGYWRTQATAYEAIAAYGYAHATLSGQSLPGFGGPERIVTCRATEEFLRVLDVEPVLGRFFAADEDHPGGPAVLVLTRGTWLRRFGGSPSVLGQTLTLDGARRTIVGVVPTLRLPGMFSCEAWLPAAYDVAANMQPGYDSWFTGDHVVARLEHGVSSHVAQAELNVLVARLERQLPRDAKGWQVHVGRWGEDLIEAEGPRLRLLSLIVATGLLLAAVNLTGLLLARTASQAKALAVRASLGATGARLLRVTLAETALIAICGGALGVVLAVWGVQLIAATAPPHLGLDTALRVDGAVLAFACGLSLLTGVGCGVVPAARAARADVASALKGLSSGTGRAGGRILAALVVVQVSLALILMVGGGLMVRSFLELRRADVGFRPDGVLTFRVSLTGSAYERPATRSAFVEALLQRLRSLPGVDRAAATVPLPMSGEYSGGPFTIDGRPAPAWWREMAAQYCLATPQYFRAMGIPVVRGREFEPADATGAPVVLVNHSLATRFFGDVDPIGQRLVDGGAIVGVVGDIRHDGPAAQPEPQIYLPFRSGAPESPSFVVRATGDPMVLAPLVRRQVGALGGDVPVDHLQSMTQVVHASMAEMRIATMIVGGFALFAVGLSSLGLYGVLAYAVSRRQQELGIRLALGATQTQLLALVLSRGAGLTLIGIAIGVPAALVASKALASFLYGTDPHDVPVFLGVPVALLAVSILASYVPARRAARVDPLSLLRRE